MMPYYPARDGYPSMFNLYDDASAAAVEPKGGEQTVNRKAARLMASGCQDASNHCPDRTQVASNDRTKTLGVIPDPEMQYRTAV